MLPLTGITIIRWQPGRLAPTHVGILFDDGSHSAQPWLRVRATALLSFDRIITRFLVLVFN